MSTAMSQQTQQGVPIHYNLRTAVTLIDKNSVRRGIKKLLRTIFCNRIVPRG